MSRGSLVARVLAATLLLGAVASSAAEETQAERYFKMRLGRLTKAAAARLWDAADKARQTALFRFAREEARRVLDLDPDNLKARQFLGYVKRDAAWEIDLALSGKLPTENQASTAERRAEAERAWRVAAARAELDVAALWAQLGDECASRGYRAEAETAYRKALDIDRNSSAAHRGLGDVALADGLWITPAANAAYEAARFVRPVAEASRYDELLGVPLAKAESGHFRVESPHDAKRIESYLAACEKTCAAYCAELAVDPTSTLFPRPPLFCVLDTDEQWTKWVNRIVQHGHQGFYRDLTCHWARDERWACAVRNHEGANDDKRRDRLAHQTVHMLSFAVFGMPDGCWLDDALAYRYPILLTGTSYAFCLSPRKQDYGSSGEGRAWSDPAEWKAMLKEMVAKKDDPELRLVVSKRSYDLPIVASIKAWSVVDRLLAKDRPAFVALLKEVGGAKSERDFVGLLETRYGKSCEDLDEDWRQWVMETF
jgi:hypothetical protein